jgi:hypothetical protein
MSKTRLYEVKTTQEDKIYLVEATSGAAAWRYVAEKLVSIEVTMADGKRVAELVTSGVKVENAAS